MGHGRPYIIAFWRFLFRFPAAVLRLCRALAMCLHNSSFTSDPAPEIKQSPGRHIRSRYPRMRWGVATSARSVLLHTGRIQYTVRTALILLSGRLSLFLRADVYRHGMRTPYLPQQPTARCLISPPSLSNLALLRSTNSQNLLNKSTSPATPLTLTKRTSKKSPKPERNGQRNKAPV